MHYLPKYPNASGAYPGPRSNPEPDAWPLTDEQAQMVVDYGGFVVISQDDDGAVVVTPNAGAWEAWKAEQAAKEPSTPPTESESDTSVWEQLDAAYREGVASAYVS